MDDKTAIEKLKYLRQTALPIEVDGLSYAIQAIEALADLRSAQVFDPAKVRELLEAIRTGCMGDELDAAAQAVRESEGK